ncbi:ADP-heptose--lipooligosaccharide heptosyltransferase II [hydrothermal vent metagenome]|uniref:ADP-heptose--lipooligosaccharide heptosyltransferase II n=1 Tax=hydrothermal vent metagenome TaxID=652676 RepID=A0A1W1EHE9_9ZZZZ
MNIIIKTPNFIGDTIMSLSAYELLKMEFPNANFTIVTPASCVDVFRDKGIKRVIIDRSRASDRNRLKLLKEIREDRYDLGVLFHNTFIDALLFKLSNIDKIIGYNKEGRKILLDFYIKLDRNRHYINHYAFLVNSYLNHKYKSLPPLKLNYQKSKLLKKDKNPLVGFVLGGENKGSRAYPQKLGLELFRVLKDENIDIILLGDRDDNLNNAIYSSSVKSQNLSGVTTVGEFIDVIASLDLLVTIDTSAMHIASATNTKFITLVGKGTSIFESVKPKVDFGVYLYKDNLDIDDRDLISNIEPQKIKDTILEVLR